MITQNEQTMDPATIKQLIESGLPEATAQVFSEDNTHFQAIVVAESFAGQRQLVRHQKVYAALGPRVGTDIHALSIRAYTPEEWRSLQGTGGEAD